MVPKKLLALAVVFFLATAISVVASELTVESGEQTQDSNSKTVDRLPASDQMVVEASTEIRASALCNDQAKMECRAPTQKTCWVTSSPKGGGTRGLYTCACGCMESKR